MPPFGMKYHYDVQCDTLAISKKPAEGLCHTCGGGYRFRTDLTDGKFHVDRACGGTEKTRRQVWSRQLGRSVRSDLTSFLERKLTVSH